MRLRIRTKFIGILMIAAVLPLVLALTAAQLLGYRYYRSAQGNLFETKAHHLASSLSLAINKQLEDLDEWITLSELYVVIGRTPVVSAPGVPADREGRVKVLEKAWEGMDENSPALREILGNPLAARLKAFRLINPLFAEVFATDGHGELIAATSKTSDYWQADEDWWRDAVALPSRSPHVEGINYDRSAGVYSIDVAFPVRDPAKPDAPPVGVVKGVIDATPLLSSLEGSSDADHTIRQVVLGTGEILVRLSGSQVLPFREQIAAPALNSITETVSGWTVTHIESGERDLIGFAALRLSNPATPDEAPSNITPMYVVVYNSVTEALEPVRKQMYLVGGIGGVLVFIFALVGYVIAGKKIIDPVESLRSAVRSVSKSAKRASQGHTASPLPEHILRKHPALERIRKLKTGDELEALAGDFAFMAQRVIGYHEDLEAEIALKTAEIQRDLEMAREFQEALMPRVYPQIPAVAASDALCLDFHHVYKPASSVGGDFFDVLKLSDHSAGVFIADVMGHGARSALVTAILRTLLQDLAEQTQDPAEFLTLINRHFHGIVSQSEEFIFVSAFYLILNTQTSEVTYATAGHPSPFFADRTRRRVSALIEDVRANPALGLFANSSYQKWTKSVIPGDLFVLFTDGLHEATNAAGEEYGLERLKAVLVENLDADPDALDHAILEDVNRFAGDYPLADDLCLVTVQVTATLRPHAAARSQVRSVTA